MTVNIFKSLIFAIIALLIVSCASNKTSVLVGGDYNKERNETDYFVIPYGSVSLPGKWVKANYLQSSKQQFFVNKDTVTVAVSFGRTDKYEFNRNNAKKGFDFIEAYYKWEHDYFTKSGLKVDRIESDQAKKYLIFRMHSPEVDTYFLMGTTKGYTSNFSISTDKWTEEEKVEFLKNLFLSSK